MGRKRIELSTAIQAEIETRTARHESADIIFSALHGTVSRSKIARIQAELRTKPARAHAAPSRPTGGVASAGHAPAKPPVDTPDVPEDVPPGTPLETLDRWIDRVETAAKKAEEQGNLPALSSLAMRAASLMEAKRKATPLPKPDPNDNPDMQALAEYGEKELLKRVHALFQPAQASG